MSGQFSEEPNDQISVENLTDISFIIDGIELGLYVAVKTLHSAYILQVARVKYPISEKIVLWHNFFCEIKDVLLNTPESHMIPVFITLAVAQPENHIIHIEILDWLQRDRRTTLWLNHIACIPYANYIKLDDLVRAHSDVISGVEDIGGGKFASFSHDKSICIWKWPEIMPMVTIVGHKKAVLGLHRLSEDEILSWSIDGTVRVWDIQSARQTCIMQGHKSAVHGIIVLESSRVISYSSDRSLRLWDVSSGDCLSVFSGHDSPVWNAMVDENVLISWGSNGSHGSVILWDMNSSEIIDDIMMFMGDVQSVYLIDKRLIICLEAGYPGIWDMSIRDWEKEAVDARNFMITEGILLDDRTVLLIDSKGVIFVWNINDDVYTARLMGHIGHTQAKEILGDRLLSWSHDGTMRLWNMQEYLSIATFYGHTAAVSDAQLRAADRIISCSLDQTIRLWNEHGMLLATYQAHQEAVKGMLWSQDQQQMLSWSDDGSIVHWSWVAERDPADRLVGAAPLASNLLLFWSEQGHLYRWDCSKLTHLPEAVEPVSREEAPAHPDALTWLPESSLPGTWDAEAAQWRAIQTVLATTTPALRADYTEHTISVFPLHASEPLVLYQSRLKVENVLGFWGEQYLLVAYEHAQIGLFQIMAGATPTMWSTLAPQNP